MSKLEVNNHVGAEQASAALEAPEVSAVPEEPEAPEVPKAPEAITDADKNLLGVSSGRWRRIRLKTGRCGGVVVGAVAGGLGVGVWAFLAVAFLQDSSFLQQKHTCLVITQSKLTIGD